MTAEYKIGGAIPAGASAVKLSEERSTGRARRPR
jgi:hypothetical protein